ncbi:hypothetical protein P9857_03285 [Anoxybacillus geothermalis]|nr:hypothetical protein [Geobacillus sp. DSP4a]MED5073072.1 hypothetical protein [Anoxybacillus geothermalis]WJQ07147.1 hypothetical protein QT235_18645 [Geobacillus stearothermophilus]
MPLAKYTAVSSNNQAGSTINAMRVSGKYAITPTTPSKKMIEM